jgi:hypothetical protein
MPVGVWFQKLATNTTPTTTASAIDASKTRKFILRGLAFRRVEHTPGPEILLRLHWAASFLLTVGTSAHVPGSRPGSLAAPREMRNPN